VLEAHFRREPIAQIDDEDWLDFLVEHQEESMPATKNRWLSVFNAIMTAGCEADKIIKPKYTKAETASEISVFLEEEEADRLETGYDEAYQPIIRMLRHIGCRSNEAVTLNVQDVDFASNHVCFRDTKNGTDRRVEMHPLVRRDLQLLIGNRKVGRVFHQPDGTPYADRRAASHGWIDPESAPEKDNAPLRKAHKAALARANLSKAFRVHDWRHHWASWYVMRGGQVHDLMRNGGWLDQRSVLRYVSLPQRFLDAKMRAS
jgi:integrase